MADSEVQIVNSALVKIGENTIVDLDEDTEPARAAKRQYPILRDRLIRNYRWNFAMKRATLALASDAPAFGFTYKFRLPTDYIRIVGIYDERERVENYTSSRVPWKVEEGFLLSNELVTQVFYLAKIENVSEFDPLFSEALALKLAVDLAYKLSTGPDRVEDLEALFQAAIREAKQADAIEGRPEVVTASDWIDSRFFYNGPLRIGPVFT